MIGGSKISEHLDLYLPYLCTHPQDQLKLVHRLDKGTSGLLIIARSAQAARQLSTLFQTNSIKKTVQHYIKLSDYQVLCCLCKSSRNECIRAVNRYWIGTNRASSKRKDDIDQLSYKFKVYTHNKIHTILFNGSNQSITFNFYLNFFH